MAGGRKGEGVFCDKGVYDLWYMTTKILRREVYKLRKEPLVYTIMTAVTLKLDGRMGVKGIIGVDTT